MKKICSYPGCKTIVEGDYRCPQHPVTIHHTPKKRYDWHFHNNKHIYGSARWQRLRDYFITMNPLCQCEQCSFLNLVTPAEVVDHIIEIKDGGDPWDVKNLQSLSRSCHARKTGQEHRKRKKKRDNNGFGSLSDY